MSEIVVGVIPARYNSSRFPGKPLVRIQGRTLIEWTFRNASKALMLDRLIVATDDSRIFSTVQKFGGQAILTSPRCKTGTDRVAEVAAKVKGDIFVNIQGDEPLIHPSIIDGMVRTLIKYKSCPIVTAAVRIKDAGMLADPNVVKVVIDHKGFAHYFSRSVIPFPRDTKDLSAAVRRNLFLKHVGIYAYRRIFLRKFLTLSRSFHEFVEKLEQLRALDWGYKIKVLVTRHDTVGVDTKADLERVEKKLSRKK
jgi:3-deoxy-manno-octulosonate cytidylyltransferase (CMP-KDO synthetase)